MTTNSIPDLNTLLREAKCVFLKEFGTEAQVGAFAPGRVNLIGEHTDYNDGFVLPMALPLMTVIVGRKIDDNISTIITTNPEIPRDEQRVDIEKPIIAGKPKWANYIRGVIAHYLDTAPNFQAVIASSVPTGGGLSSSASLEVAMYMFLDAITESSTHNQTDKALACQKAEHNYASVPCGIMDQFISILGEKNNALLIDCRSLTSTLIPFSEPNIAILITNSNVKHELDGSEYATRRKQCQEAALLLKKLSLRDATEDDIEYLKSINADDELVKRARHVVTEIRRTENAAEALKERNYIKFGQLMTESHKSLKNDYEVSCAELDSLVDAALEVDGVLGARITGAGFGGCTVTMAYKNSLPALIKHLKEAYKGTSTFYVSTPSVGARVIRNI